MPNPTGPTAAEGMFKAGHKADATGAPIIGALPLVSAPAGETPTHLLLELNPAFFAGLSLEDLRDIHDGTFCLSGVLAGLSSQPRFRPQEDGNRTAAGVVMFDLLELVNGIQDAAHKAVRAHVPTTEDEANLRAGVLMFDAATSGEVTTSLVDLAAIIAPHATSQENDR